MWAIRISHGRSGRPFGLAPGALEVAVGLQEGLLGEVLGVVVVADPVVGVGVDVAQVVAVELLEGAVELGLRLAGSPSLGAGSDRSRSRVTRPSLAPRAIRSGRLPRALGPPQPGDPLARRRSRPRSAPRGPRAPGASTPGARDRLGDQRHRVEALRRLADARPGSAPPGRPLPSSSPARRLRLPGARTSRSGRRPRRGRRRSRARPPRASA